MFASEPFAVSPGGKNVRANSAAGRLAARRHRAAPGGKESITLCAFYMQGIALHALVGLENEAVAVAAMRASNPDCPYLTINGGHAAPTPTGFAEIVGDDFPVFNRHGGCLLIVQHRLRCGFVYFKLCAHFLQTGSKRCNLLL